MKRSFSQFPSERLRLVNMTANTDLESVKAIFSRLKTHVDVREFLDVVGAVLLCLLAEGDEELHLVPWVQVGNVAPVGQRVHVEEDVLIGVVLPLVGNETILCRGEGGREGELGGERERSGRVGGSMERREKGEKGGKTRNRGRERREGEYNCVTENQSIQWPHVSK